MSGDVEVARSLGRAVLDGLECHLRRVDERLRRIEGLERRDRWGRGERVDTRADHWGPRADAPIDALRGEAAAGPLSWDRKGGERAARTLRANAEAAGVWPVSIATSRARLETSLSDARAVDARTLLKEILTAALADVEGVSRLAADLDANLTGSPRPLRIETGSALTPAFMQWVEEVLPREESERSPLREELGTTGELIAPFGVDALAHALGGRHRMGFQMLTDAVESGRLRGLVLATGEKGRVQGFDPVSVAGELLSGSVLVLHLGAGATALAEAGLARPEAAARSATGLREVCEAVGIPPVLHFGSLLHTAEVWSVLAGVVGNEGPMENLARLPVVFLASDLEAAGRSIVAFGAAASGIPVVTAPVAGLDGAPEVRRFLETEIRESLGGHFVFEADPAKIAARALECLDERRAALNLKAVRA